MKQKIGEEERINLRFIKAPTGIIVKGFYNSQVTSIRIKTGKHAVQTDEDIMPVFEDSIILVFTKQIDGSNKFSVFQQHLGFQRLHFSCTFKSVEEYKDNPYFKQYDDFIQYCLKKF